MVFCSFFYICVQVSVCVFKPLCVSDCIVYVCVCVCRLATHTHTHTLLRAWNTRQGMMGGEEKRSSPVSRGNAGNRRISDDDDDSADASLLRSLSLGNFSSPDSFVKTHCITHVMKRFICLPDLHKKSQRPQSLHTGFLSTHTHTGS